VTEIRVKATVYLVSFVVYTLKTSDLWLTGKPRWAMHRLICLPVGVETLMMHRRVSFRFLFILVQEIVYLPKDRVSMTHQGYGFCENLTED